MPKPCPNGAHFGDQVYLKRIDYCFLGDLIKIIFLIKLSNNVFITLSKKWLSKTLHKLVSATNIVASLILTS